MSHEPNVVVECAKTFLNPEAAASLKRALAGNVDWDEVERHANEDCMLPIVIHVLSVFGVGFIPKDRLVRFQNLLLHTTCNNLIFVQEWLRLLEALARAEIRVISLKGAALGLMAYRNVSLREFSDLDLLVQAQDVWRARDVLVRHGYVLDSILLNDIGAALALDQNSEISFVNATRGITVDLHCNVLDNRFSFQLETSQLFNEARTERHEGISFLSLSPEHLLLYLCAHGTKHSWTRLRWLCDVAYYVQFKQNLDWNLCVRLAELAGCELVLKHTLLMARQVLGLALPESISQYASQDSSAHLLAGKAQEFLFRENHNRPQSLKVLQYHLAFAKAWHGGAWLVLKPLFGPTMKDWYCVRLPRSLHPLYYLIRPVRLVIKYMGRIWHTWGRR
jgi:hypothetical protein